MKGRLEPAACNCHLILAAVTSSSQLVVMSLMNIYGAHIFTLDA